MLSILHILGERNKMICPYCYAPIQPRKEQMFKKTTLLCPNGHTVNLGFCLRCRRWAVVRIYRFDEPVCDECQRIWVEVSKNLDCYSSEFLRERKRFLFGDNPSHREGEIDGLSKMSKF